MSAEWDPYRGDCPSRMLLDRIGDRWTVLVVGVLSDGPHRFSELGRRVVGISQKMLTQTLRTLEEDGFVQRTVYAEVPPRVEYALTEMGTEVAAHLAALGTWVERNLPRVMAARGGRER